MNKIPEPKIVFMSKKDRGKDYFGQAADLVWRNKKPTIRVYSKRKYLSHPYIHEHEMAHIRVDSSLGKHTATYTNFGEACVYEIKAERELNRKWLKTTQLTGRQVNHLIYQVWVIMKKRYDMGTFNEFINEGLYDMKSKARKMLTKIGLHSYELEDAGAVLKIDKGIIPEKLYESWDKFKDKARK